MKNLNPKSGLRQVCTGKNYFPRRLVLELIKSGKLKPSELGYYVIAIISADWNEGEYRYGLIRHETKKLSSMWGIPYTTLLDNLNNLVKKGLLSEKHNSFQINNFDCFAKAQNQYSTKNTISDEELELIFGKLLQQSEISETYQTKNNQSLKVSSNVELNKLITIQPKRTQADYLQIYQENEYQYIIPEDMKWLDEHITADGRTIL